MPSPTCLLRQEELCVDGQPRTQTQHLWDYPVRRCVGRTWFYWPSMMVAQLAALGGGLAWYLRPCPGMFQKTRCNWVAVEETTDKVMTLLAGHFQR